MDTLRITTDRGELVATTAGTWTLAHNGCTWKVIQGVVLKAYSASAAVMVCSNVSRGRR